MRCSPLNRALVRFAFEKFAGSKPELTTAMKSVGEVMAIGRTFHESMQKALASMETGLSGFDEIEIPGAPDTAAIIKAISAQTPDRIRLIAQAMRHGLSLDEIQHATSYDPWFLERIHEIVEAEADIRKNGLPLDEKGLRKLKMMGFTDARLVTLTGRILSDIIVGLSPSGKALAFDASIPWFESR